MNGSHIRPFLILGGVLALMAIATDYWIPGGIPGAVLWMIPAYAVLTWILNIYIRKAAANNPRRFVTAVIGSISVKLFLSALFMGLYVWFKGPQKVTVAIALFIIYMAFTVVLVKNVGRKTT